VHESSSPLRRGRESVGIGYLMLVAAGCLVVVGPRSAQSASPGAAPLPRGAAPETATPEDPAAGVELALQQDATAILGLVLFYDEAATGYAADEARLRKLVETYGRLGLRVFAYFAVAQGETSRRRAEFAYGAAFDDPTSRERTRWGVAGQPSAAFLITWRAALLLQSVTPAVAMAKAEAHLRDYPRIKLELRSGKELGPGERQLEPSRLRVLESAFLRQRFRMAYDERGLQVYRRLKEQSSKDVFDDDLKEPVGELPPPNLTLVAHLQLAARRGAPESLVLTAVGGSLAFPHAVLQRLDRPSDAASFEAALATVVAALGYEQNRGLIAAPGAAATDGGSGLQVKTKPGGAEIYLGGQFQGLSSEGETGTFSLELPPGEFAVSLKHRAYFGANFSVVSRRGESVTVLVSLSPLGEDAKQAPTYTIERCTLPGFKETGHEPTQHGLPVLTTSAGRTRVDCRTAARAPILAEWRAHTWWAAGSFAAALALGGAGYYALDQGLAERDKALDYQDRYEVERDPTRVDQLRTAKKDAWSTYQLDTGVAVGCFALSAASLGYAAYQLWSLPADPGPGVAGPLAWHPVVLPTTDAVAFSIAGGF